MAVSAKPQPHATEPDAELPGTALVRILIGCTEQAGAPLRQPQNALRLRLRQGLGTAQAAMHGAVAALGYSWFEALIGLAALAITLGLAYKLLYDYVRITG